MSKSDEEFYLELLDDFKEEGAEHLQTIVNGLLEVEKDHGSSENQELLETMFRETHSLKGASRALELKNIESLCMTMENVMHKVKNRELEFSPGFFDVFFEATDILEVLISEIKSDKQSITKNRISKIVNKLKSLEKGENPGKANHSKRQITPAKDTGTKPPDKGEHSVKSTENSTIEEKDMDEQEADEAPSGKADASESPNEENYSQNETIRVTIQKLNDILFSAEEMITSKAVLRYQVQQIDSVSKKFSKLKKEISETFSDNKPEDKIAESLNALESDLSHSAKQLEELLRSNNRGVDDLNFKVKKAMMQPFSVLLSIIPRITRDLSKEHDKKINLNIEGEHIEIDRRILEQMKDPLIHLIRNSIDHGIETTSERLKNNKNEQGSLSLKVFHEAGQKICITLQDDGKGLSQQKIINAAIKAKAIDSRDVKELSDEQINQLIFASGVSTSPIITDVSGRGLGMAIVAENINHLGGKVSVSTKHGKGTTFRIELPQTLASFKGILTEVSGQRFLIPTASVYKALKVNKSEVRTVESKNIIRFKDESISLVSLADVLGLRKKSSAGNTNKLQVLIVKNNAKTGFSVDKVLGEHEGMVKSLGKQLKHLRNIEGACFMGDGSVVPVLQVEELMTATRKASGGRVYNASVKPEKTDSSNTKKVLYAEDSITVRNMVRSHIEAAGYEVSTAVDGQSAFELLQKEAFDLVVSDVEMPRMNGFELTSKIRKDASLGHLPIILVTSLDSKTDRERGLESGANAYIVKSSFEKSNLIDTINRLI